MATALEAAVALFRTLPDVVGITGLRIGARHRYGDTLAGAWLTDPVEPGIVVASPGGPVGDVPGLHAAALEVTCYAGSPEAALALWEVLAEACGAVRRQVVPLVGGSPSGQDSGRVLVYFCEPASEPSALLDEETGLDVALASFNIMSSGREMTL